MSVPCQSQDTGIRFNEFWINIIPTPVLSLSQSVSTATSPNLKPATTSTGLIIGCYAVHSKPQIIWAAAVLAAYEIYQYIAQIGPTIQFNVLLVSAKQYCWLVSGFHPQFISTSLHHATMTRYYTQQNWTNAHPPLKITVINFSGFQNIHWCYTLSMWIWCTVLWSTLIILFLYCNEISKNHHEAYNRWLLQMFQFTRYLDTTFLGFLIVTFHLYFCSACFSFVW